MSEPRCSLCGSHRLIIESQRRSAELVTAYSARFGVDTQRFFPASTVATYRCAECDLRSHFTAIPGDSAFYDPMQEHPFYYERNKPEFDFAIDQLISIGARRVLEVGCGEGNFLGKVAGAFDVRGSELSAKSIAKLQAAGIALDTTSDRYDFVCTFQVLEHVPDADGFLRFMIGKLEPGGHLLVTVPNRDSKYIAEGTSSILDFPPHHMTQWSRRALEGLAPRYGLALAGYYEEPIRPAHMTGLLSARRLQIPAGKRTRWLGSKLGRLVDLVAVPYHVDRVSYAGHTHGVLLRKPAQATDTH